LKDGPPGRWIILEGNFHEGVDQLSEARATSAGRRLLTAYAVKPWLWRGGWLLGLEAPESGDVELALPYVAHAERGLFCTGYRVLEEPPLLATPRLVLAAELEPRQPPPRKRATPPTRDAGDAPGAAAEAKTPATPPMWRHRKGFLLGEPALHGEAALSDEKVVFTGKGEAARFSRPLRLHERTFLAGDRLTFRPAIRAPAGQGVVIELRDDQGARLARWEFIGASDDRPRSDGLRHGVSRNMDFVYIVITRSGDADGPVTVDQVKMKVTDAAGAMVGAVKIIP